MSEDHVIISKPVREIADPLLDLVEKTYTSSFPEEERRDFSLVRKLLEEDSRFEMYALLRDGIYVGFITGGNLRALFMRSISQSTSPLVTEESEQKQ